MKNPKYRQEYTFPTEAQRLQWHVLRRVKATGLLWNKASDGWLNIHGLTAHNRTEAFDGLVQTGQVMELSVTGISQKCYIPSSAKPILEDVIEGTHHKKRCELIAPLDSLIWDRKLIKALFDFDYKWEIYTPKEKQKYGYYTMPVVYGADFVGRIELQYNRKTEKLTIENLWLEPWFKETNTFHLALNRTIKRLEQLNFLTAKG
ncbi:crosslink repair DNA glycosylase YcaQ family protein [Bengtsoniella intestinalis]|uniref:DNA glycosylase AlkZ-like family protein n=1 Tax=Bengtsoniella intestinalis TaxID=3073143 RepID=UPI00391EF615